jgi:hypothetical protein
MNGCPLPKNGFAMKSVRLLSTGFGLLLFAVASARAAETPPSKEALEFFESRVRPILVANCISCHGDGKQKAGLRLDSRAALLKGGRSGPAVTPGEPDKSRLVHAIHYDAKPKMPPEAKLPDEAIVTLTDWVKLGAPWPESAAGQTQLGAANVSEMRKMHWSFRAITDPPVPKVKDSAWATSPIDCFILAKLESKGMRPARPADRRTLIRRATFDLIGLPPTPEDIAAFESDSSPDAFRRVVDRLLASPQYGERWGRHWLDVARYADTKGYVFQEERRYPYAYTYRDYVVRSLNEDLPYDQFIVQQLAADRLDLGEDRRALAAMGYLTLGRRFLNNKQDIIDDRIDVVSRGLLGLTVTCARCHDHKFDPIPTKDYYSLYGVFASSIEPDDLPLLGKPNRTPEYESFEKELQNRQRGITEFLEKTRGELEATYRKRAGEYLLAAHTTPPERAPGRRALTANELHPSIINRWQAIVRESLKTHRRVLGPWNQFTALPAQEFSAKAPDLVRSIAANADSASSINPLVAKAFADKSPTRLEDVASIYGELFHAVDQRWKETIAKAKSANESAPTKLPDNDWEEVRQVFYPPSDLTGEDVSKYYDRAVRDKVAELRRKVEEWKASSPAAPPRAMVLNDTPTPQEPHVLLRGNPNSPGDAVPRQFLLVLAGDQRKPFHDGSGRLELARAIATRDNTLTARVLVNRVWLHHFGAGLVRTPSDFGVRGEPPTHPELLDYLATRFMEDGWSIKKLHRRIMFSSVYQESSSVDPNAVQADPENRLLARHDRQRLEFEALRDSLLFVSGQLDLRQGGAAVDLLKTPYSARRTIYGFIDRQNVPGLFRSFDMASPDTSNPQRFTTTVPQQALYLMNNAFVAEQARQLINRLVVASLPDTASKIKQLYLLAYGRLPDAEELKLGKSYLEPVFGKPADAATWQEYAQVLLLANEFTFVD